MRGKAKQNSRVVESRPRSSGLWLVRGQPQRLRRARLWAILTRRTRNAKDAESRGKAKQSAEVTRAQMPNAKGQILSVELFWSVKFNSEVQAPVRSV